MDAINTFSEQQIVQLEVDFLEDYKIALEVLGDNAFYENKEDLIP